MKTGYFGVGTTQASRRKARGDNKAGKLHSMYKLNKI